MREPRPVTRVEISEKNSRLRMIAVIALLVIGVVGITVGVINFLNKDTGWQMVEVTTKERSCSENFALQYNFSGSGAEASAVNNQLQAVYSEACVKAYRLFTADENVDGIQNVYYVNHHPNEIITVDPVLYAAFEKLEGTPWLYLGPAYAHYYNVILTAEESMVQELDPAISQDARAYVERIAEFAKDPDAIQLELLGNNQLILRVSDAYLAFAVEEEISHFIDFSYLTNAFIIDYLAEVLVAQELTNGYIVSVDGYTRNLDSRNHFRFNIFDRVGNVVHPAAVMDYRGPISIVFLKNYPIAKSDVNYRGSDDRILHLFVDPRDGMYRTSVEELVGYSYDAGCADVLLQMLPSFVGDNFSVPEGVFSVWCEDQTVFHNDESVSFADLMKNEDISYRVELQK